jgi:hypothetical protein
VKRQYRHVWAAVWWDGQTWVANTTGQPEREGSGETIGAALGMLEAALADRAAHNLGVLDGTPDPDLPCSYLVARVRVRAPGVS